MTILAGSALILLSACGGGDGVMTTRTFAVDTPTPALALAEGKTLTAQAGQTAALKTDYPNQTTVTKDSNISIFKNADGELSMVINGETTNFTILDRNSGNGDEFYAYSKDGIEEDDLQQWQALISFNGDIISFLDGTNTRNVLVFKHRDVKSPISDLTQADGEVGYFVVGTETQQSALGNFTTKDYTAMLQADIFPTVGFESTQNRSELRSEELNLTANFEQNSIVGVANNITVRTRERGVTVPDFTSVGGTLVFSGGTISGSDFTGIITSDEQLNSALQITNYTGEFNGSFYGTEAQAIGGVISGSATTATDNLNVIGGFSSN